MTLKGLMEPFINGNYPYNYKMNNITVNIAKDYAVSTGLRHTDISDRSGEDFYHTVLNAKFKEALDNNVNLEVDLDGGRGYSPSFLDEAFGNLIYDFSEELVSKRLIIKSKKFEMWVNYIKRETFRLWEERRREKIAPTKTKSHSDWWHFNKYGFKKINIAQQD